MEGVQVISILRREVKRRNKGKGGVYEFDDNGSDTNDRSSNNATQDHDLEQTRVGIIIAGVNMIIGIVMWLRLDNSDTNYQMVNGYLMGVDGISVMFIVLTTFITLQTISIVETRGERVMILVISSLLIMTFMSLDILVWYICFETVLIPMFLMIINQKKKSDRDKGCGI